MDLFRSINDIAHLTVKHSTSIQRTWISGLAASTLALNASAPTCAAELAVVDAGIWQVGPQGVLAIPGIFATREDACDSALDAYLGSAQGYSLLCGPTVYRPGGSGGGCEAFCYLVSQDRTNYIQRGRWYNRSPITEDYRADGADGTKACEPDVSNLCDVVTGRKTQLDIDIEFGILDLSSYSDYSDYSDVSPDTEISVRGGIHSNPDWTSEAPTTPKDPKRPQKTPIRDTSAD